MQRPSLASRTRPTPPTASAAEPPTRTHQSPRTDTQSGMAHTRTPTHGHPADGSHTHARAPRKVGMDESNQSMQCERYPPLTLGGMRVSQRDPPIGSGVRRGAPATGRNARERRACMQCPRTISCVSPREHQSCTASVPSPPDTSDHPPVGSLDEREARNEKRRKAREQQQAAGPPSRPG